jgi:hypothetical protein
VTVTVFDITASDVTAFDVTTFEMTAEVTTTVTPITNTCVRRQQDAAHWTSVVLGVEPEPHIEASKTVADQQAPFPG